MQNMPNIMYIRSGRKSGVPAEKKAHTADFGLKIQGRLVKCTRERGENRRNSEEVCIA